MFSSPLGWQPTSPFVFRLRSFLGCCCLLRSTIEDLLDALDDNLSGAALDVTDPEPLSDGHPLWTHPNVIITPHISGNAESEGEHAVDLLLQNAKRFVEEKEFFNVVDIEKGY